MTDGFLVVRCDGALWGLPAGEVAGIERVERVERANGPSSAPRSYQVRLSGGGTLAVDAVLTLAGELRIRPLSTRLRRFLPPGSSGLAMHAGEPILLMTRKGEAPHD